MRSGLSSILNVDLSDIQWLQACLPVRHGGLGIRSAAPSAIFSVSCIDARPSAVDSSGAYTRSRNDDSILTAETRWMSLSGNSTSATELVHIQRAWDSLVCKKHEQLVWSHASTDIDKARLLAAASPHSGDWLAAPPITSVGLRLSDEQLRISVAHRLGERANHTHEAVEKWWTQVDSMGWPVGKAPQDNNAVHISTTSCGVQ